VKIHKASRPISRGCNLFDSMGVNASKISRYSRQAYKAWTATGSIITHHLLPEEIIYQ
jgi:hypothetical protein